MSTLYEAVNSGTPNSYDSGYGANWHGMTFTPAVAHKITSVKLYLYRVGTPGTYTVSIRATSGGNPTGADLCSGSIDGDSLTTNAAGEWYEITLGDGCDLAADTMYAIVARAPAGTSSSDCVRWKLKADAYADGDRQDSTNSGDTWGTLAADFFFEDWGVPLPQTITLTAGIASAEAFGTPALAVTLTILPSGIASAEAFGDATLVLMLQLLYPTPINSLEAFGNAQLIKQQFLIPSSIASLETFGTTIVTTQQRLYPQSIASIEAFGLAVIARSTYHVILDGRFVSLSPAANRLYVIGRDASGNPVYGTAVDSTELGLVGERLDFQLELSIPTSALAASVAEAMLAKQRLSSKAGYIVIPPNCGAELWDVVQVTDAPTAQSAAPYRVTGIQFSYLVAANKPKLTHKLILGAR